MMLSQLVVQRTDEGQSFVTRRIAGETLIVPVTGHVMNLESIYVVNDVASRIWELMASPTTIERIADTLAGEFAVSPDQASDDVIEFLASMSDRGLVRYLTETG